MKQENNQQQENCPLCESSKEVMKRLSLESGIADKQKIKLFWKGLIILGLIGLGVFSIYIFMSNFRSNFSPQAPKNNKSAEVGVFQGGRALPLWLI